MIICEDSFTWQTQISWRKLKYSCRSNNETGCKDPQDPPGGTWQCDQEKQTYSDLYPEGTACGSSCFNVEVKLKGIRLISLIRN